MRSSAVSTCPYSIVQLRANAELVRLAVHVDPLLAGQLLLGDRGAHGRAEDFCAAAGQRVESRLVQRDQHVARRCIFSMRARCAISTAVSALMCTCGMARLECRGSCRCSSSRPAFMSRPPTMWNSRVMASRARAASRTPGRAYSGRCPSSFGSRAIRAEGAGVAQDADVGGVDVLVRGEGDAVAVLRAVGDIGEDAETDQVAVRRTARSPSWRVRPLPSAHACPRWAERGVRRSVTGRSERDVIGSRATPRTVAHRQRDVVAARSRRSC